MSTFDQITPFGLVRALGAGGDSPAIYLLMCEDPLVDAVKDELRAELDIQLDVRPVTKSLAELCDTGITSANGGSVQLIDIDRWRPDLVDALDRHAPFLAPDGSQLLFLTPEDTAMRMIAKAPNLRSRWTGIFQITPENLSGERT